MLELGKTYVDSTGRTIKIVYVYTQGDSVFKYEGTCKDGYFFYYDTQGQHKNPLYSLIN
jgi:hypothetical protein